MKAADPEIVAPFEEVVLLLLTLELPSVFKLEDELDMEPTVDPNPVPPATANPPVCVVVVVEECPPPPQLLIVIPAIAGEANPTTNANESNVFFIVLLV